MMLSIKLYKNFLTFNLIVNSVSQKKKKSANHQWLPQKGVAKTEQSIELLPKEIDHLLGN